MKTRNGFVSNSSSSSFVVMGIKLKKTNVPDDIYEEDTENLSVFGIDNEYIIGTSLGESFSDGDCMPDNDYTFEQLNEISNKTKESIKKILNIDSNPKLILGTRSC